MKETNNSRRRYLGLVICLAILFGAFVAQPSLRSANAAVPTSCAAVRQEIRGLKRAKARLQRQLRHASSSEKQALMVQIREYMGEIRAKQLELSHCTH
jgi:hypothetical protein